MAKNIISDIYFSRAFRRMAGKTQLFSNYNNDHFHNRLTHTLEVTHIAERIRQQIGGIGSIYVIIAASLAHDLGHTPFGHAGERALNDITYHIDDLNGIVNPQFTNRIIFKHNYYSGKVLLGINVNNVKINTILAAVINHTDLEYPEHHLSSDEINSTLRFYLKNYQLRNSVIKKINNQIIESQIVALADEIAQRVSDLHDIALAKALIITEKEMTGFLPKEELEKVEGYPNKIRIKSLMSVYKEHLISGVSYDSTTNRLVMNKQQDCEMSYIKGVCKNIIKCSKDISNYDKNSETIVKYIFRELYKNPFLLDEKMVNEIYLRIYSITRVDFDNKKLVNKPLKVFAGNEISLKEKCIFLKRISRDCIRMIKHKECIDNDYSHYLRTINSELVYGIVFYIANMTDRFAREKYNNLKNCKKRLKLIIDKNKTSN